MRRAAVITLAAGSLASVASLAASGHASPTPTTPTTPSAMTTAEPSAGALYPPGGFAFHVCSGAVLRSATRDLVATAAHCILGTGAHSVFVPGLSGSAPYGRWKVRGTWVDRGWRLHRSATRDLAILRVAPQLRDGRTVRIEDVVRGAALGHAPIAGTPVHPVGYVAGTGRTPVACDAPTSTTNGRWPTFDCAGFLDGTSGGPWLTGPPGRRTVVGLISGLHQGGCTPERSYSVSLGAWSDELLARAERGYTSDHVPPAPSDGC